MQSTTPVLIRNDLNYGQIIKANIAGIDFFMEEWQLPKLSCVQLSKEQGEIPEFHAVRVELQLKRVPNTILVFLAKDGDLREVARLLSKYCDNVEYAAAYSSARYLAIWKDGNLTGDVKKLSDFYTNISPEEDLANTF